MPVSQRQLLRLQQLVSEYLLYVQETLHKRTTTLEGALGAAQSQLRDQAEYIGVLESQLRAKGGALPSPLSPPPAAAGAAASAAKPPAHPALAWLVILGKMTDSSTSLWAVMGSGGGGGGGTSTRGGATSSTSSGHTRP